MDDLRADRVGGPGSRTPRLDAFFSSGVAFTQAVSQAPWSLPSFLSVMTGEDPSRHGVTNKYSDFAADPPIAARLRASSETLAEILKRRGLRTAGFTGGAALDRSFGLGDGFEVYADSAPFAGFERTIPQALAWLKTLEPGERFFLFVHGYDAHPFHPGRLGPELDRRYRARREEQLKGRRPPAGERDKAELTGLYDDAVRTMDERLAPLWAALDSPELRGRTVVAAFADHGEELFDHGGIDHGLTLHEEMLRVPLLLRAPGLTPRREGSQVRLIDLLPTALELLGVPEPQAACVQRDGLSLAPLLEGKPLALDAFSETDFLLAASLRSLRTSDGWKLVYDRKTRRSSLFDIHADPGEASDRSQVEAARLQALEDRLLDAFEEERTTGGSAKAVCEGPWKLVRRGKTARLFDLRADPLQTNDLSSERPDVARRLLTSSRGSR
jgi:arylsulfatase A-like enzyme